MIAILEATSGLEKGHRLFLRTGQSARVGRTEWADWALRFDQRMADVHFQLVHQPGGCRLSDLSGGYTLVNRQAVTETRLRTGDRIQAGETTFVFELQGEAVEPSMRRDESAAIDEVGSPAEPVSAFPFGATLPEISAWAELSDGSRSTIGSATTLREAVRLLAPRQPACEVAREPTAIRRPATAASTPSERPLLDAIRLMAFAMPTATGVRWACQASQAVLETPRGKLEQAAIDAAAQWLERDCPAHRQAAARAADDAGLRSSAGCTALAAAWSAGPNIDGTSASEPADEPSEEEGREADEIELLRRARENHVLAAKAIAVALTLVGVESRTGDTQSSYGRLIELGLRISSDVNGPSPTPAETVSPGDS